MELSKTLKALASVAIVFGALTVFSGGRVLFSSAGTQAGAGKAVPFVLWFNFLAGFAYVVAGVGFWCRQRWASVVAMTLVALTAAVAVAFAVHVQNGGAYELRTVGAMALRLLFWSVVAISACVSFSRYTAASSAVSMPAKSSGCIRDFMKASVK